jgi:aryl-alcohol dehydrogenase-like predicted oxidoreductase
MACAEGMALLPWGAFGGGNFKTEKAQKEGESVGAKGMGANAIKISPVLERIANSKSTKGSIIPLTSMALAYVMQKTPYVFPVVGGRQIEQLKDNIEALSLRLNDEDIKEIEEAGGQSI